MINKLKADEYVKNFETFYCKEQKIKECDIYIYNYLLSDKEAFKGIGKELRGLTIVKEDAKENIFLSIPKFFNINEIPENMEYVLKNKKIKKVREKLDGSLIQPIRVCGDVTMKTKQNFGNHAKIAQEIVDSNDKIKFFILDCWDNNFQPLFEIVGQENKIVVDYKETRLVLIAVRNQDGEFIDIDKFDYPDKAKSYNLTLDEIIHSAKNDKGIEGYVVHFTDGSIVKIKTLDYLEKHKIISELSSMKTIFKRILEENMDDLYAVIPENKIKEIQEIEKIVNNYVIHYIKQISDIVKNGDMGNRISFVEKYKSHKYFNVIMSCLKGYDCKEELIKTLLKRYNKEEKVKKFIEEMRKL